VDALGLCARALWLAALVLGFGVAGVVDVPLDLHGDWPAAAFALGPVVALLGALHLAARGVGAFGRFAGAASRRRRDAGRGARRVLVPSRERARARRLGAAAVPAAARPTDLALALLGIALGRLVVARAARSPWCCRASGAPRSRPDSPRSHSHG
jgi:hypothetical protein